MEAIHARYPFLDSARTAVAEADVDLATLIQTDDPAVGRSRDRVMRALTDGTVETDRRIPSRTELLSYPLGRVLVSLLDVPGAVDKYATAEATTAAQRIEADLSRPDRALSLESLADDLGLGGSIEWPTGDGQYRIAVERYLELAPDGPAWSLAVRELAAGQVTISREELLALLQRTIELQVRDGLPFSVPESIADELAPTVTAIEQELTGVQYPTSIDRFEPAAFPPCIRTLYERAPDESLDHRERFALITCCGAVGLDAAEVVSRCGRTDDASFVYAAERLVGDPLPYPPPSFETLQAAGICTESHEAFEHPIEAYAAALSDGPESDPSATE